MNVICPACGQSNSTPVRFCSTCGQLLAGREQIAVPGSNFTGRQSELDFLQAKLSEAVAGHGALTLVAGEAGIGKTALAQYFAALARQAGAVVLWGACFEGEWRPPYGPWVEALSYLIRTLEPEQLRHHLGTGGPPLVQLVPHLHTLLPDIPTPATLNPNEERFRLYDALTQFLLSLAAEQPVVLILDDLHWADPDSLEALRYVARFARRGCLLLIGLYREAEISRDDRSQTVAALWREANYERLLLAGLTRQEVAGYLAQAAGQDLPQALAQTIHAETNGNPFYARQLWQHLVEEAKIVHRQGRWATDFSMVELGIPAGVRQVVARRLARLSANANILLRVAAAFTGGFHFHLLTRLTGLAEDSLLDALDEALQAGLIASQPGPPAQYDFVHAIVRHTLYDDLNPDRRARLHRRIAEALEQAPAYQRPDYNAELAFQYHASMTLPGADQGIPFCLAAAEQARANYAHEQTVIFLRMTRDLALNSPASLRAEIACKLAIAEADTLLLEEARHTADEALAALVENSTPPETIADFLATIAWALKEGGAAPSVWQPLVEHGLTLTGDRRDIIWARLMLLLGRVEPLSTEFVYVSRWLGYDPQAIALARTAGDEADYARTLDPFAWRSPQETERVLVLARSWQRPTAILRALDMAARDLIYRHGDIPVAVERLQELLVAGQRYGSIPTQAEALVQLAVCQTLLGELAAAQQTYHQAQEMAARLGPMHRLRALALTAVESVLADYAEGDWPRLAQEAARYATDPQSGRGPLGLVATNFATYNSYRAGNAPEARRFLAALTAVIEQAPPTMYIYNGAVDRAAHVVWRLEAVEYAETYHRLALDLLDDGQPGSPPCSNALNVARMAALLGHLPKARTFFDRARRDIEAGGQRPLLAITDYDQALALSRAGSADHARIKALLDSALIQFQTMGMTGWAERTLALKKKESAPQPATNDSANLTSRELEVLRLIAAGHTNKEIAAALVISLATTERHIANIYNKIDVRNRAEATIYALSQGLAAPRDLTRKN